MRIPWTDVSCAVLTWLIVGCMVFYGFLEAFPWMVRLQVAVAIGVSIRLVVVVFYRWHQSRKAQDG
jgi:membrane protein implicated in regulation of membrane protease activity